MFDKGKRDKSKAENEARNIKMSVRNVCKSMMDQEKRGEGRRETKASDKNGRI